MLFRRPLPILLIFLFLCSLFGFSCGEDESREDVPSPQLDDDDGDEADGLFEGDAEADIDQNNRLITNDDPWDDDDETPPDVEYDPLFCPAPDPEGIGAGRLFGGGPILDQVFVYVFDDQDCEPLAGAKVIRDTGSFVTYTDANGHAVVPVSQVPAQITASYLGYWFWSYLADARVMYFRLRPKAYTGRFWDSPEVTYLHEGAPILLDNPQSISDAFFQPILIGITLPNMARNALLQMDPYAMLAYQTFPIDYQYSWNYTSPVTGTIHFSRCFYLPYATVDFSIPGVLDFYFEAENTETMFRYHELAETVAVQADIMEIHLSKALGILDFYQIITDIDAGVDPLEVIIPPLKKLIRKGLRFPYIGAMPDWHQGAPWDMELVQVQAPLGGLQFSIKNYDPAYDYLQFLVAEIPNRAMIPMSVNMAEDGVSNMPYASLPDGDYIALAAKTDIFNTHPYAQTISFASAYTEDIDDWDAGVSIDDSQFAPFFDPSECSYNGTTGQITWELMPGGDAMVDVFWVFYIANVWGNTEYVLAVLPPDRRSYQPPVNELGIVPYLYRDNVVVVALDLPMDFEEGFDPTVMTGYPISTGSMWAWPNLAEVTLDLFNGYF